MEEIDSMVKELTKECAKALSKGYCIKEKEAEQTLEPVIQKFVDKKFSFFG